MQKVSILTIGDEICIGQIVNTNAVWIAEECTKLGAEVLTHSSIKDDKKIIISELDRLLGFSDFLILTGGLGPTHDDITKPTLLEYFNDEYIYNEEVAAELERRFKLWNIVLSERNNSQAYLPSKCTPLWNSVGTAPGMLFEKDGKYIVSLPGVPREMIYIMTEHVLPLLKKLISEKIDGIVLYKNILTSGIPESKLADLIGEPSEFLGDNSLAFLPSYKGVRLRIGVSAPNLQIAESKIATIEKHIRSRAEKFIYGTGNDTLTKKVAEILLKSKETVAVAESCTGGMLGSEFTELSGSSEYFMGGVISYSNNAKLEILGIDNRLLIDFGAVSQQTCEAMAMKVQKKFGTDYGISITGIAGPTGGTPEKPVGTVWIGIASADGVESKLFNFGVDRKINRERAVGTAMNMFYKILSERD